MTEEIKFDPIIIRYDGLDADDHQIGLADFGQSALGFSKIIATTAQFIATSNYRKSQRKLDFKVLIGCAKDNCISFEAIIKAAENKDLMTAGLAFFGVMAANVATDLYRAVTSFLWKKSRVKRMKTIQRILRIPLN